MQILGISDFFFFWKKVIRPFWRKSLVPDSPTPTGVGTFLFFVKIVIFWIQIRATISSEFSNGDCNLLGTVPKGDNVL